MIERDALREIEDCTVARSRSVLITGAGASAPFGFPVMATFMARAIRGKLDAAQSEFLRQINPGGVGDLEAVMVRLNSVVNTLKSAQNDPILSSGISILKPVMTIDEYSADVLTGLDGTIRDAIFEVYSREPDVNQLRQALDPLFNLILENRPPTDSVVPVFTFNYDLCLETYLVGKASWLAEDGFPATPGRQYWQPGRFLFGIFTNFETPLESPAVAIFKLHGSVNWRRERSGRIRKADVPARRPGDLEEVVIYPGLHVLSPSEPFAIAYAYLEACMAHAQEVFIVGYALADEAFKQHVQRGLARNSAKVAVFHIDPAWQNPERADGLGKILNSLGFSPVKFYPQKIEDLRPEDINKDRRELGLL